jgi:photosynthetic reaction center cytochrome c subunit
MRLLLTILMVFPLCAQAPPGPPPGPPPGEAKASLPAFKNLQLLKPEEIRGAMGAFRVALGVDCGFCHVRGDFASDENHHKIVARKMIGLVRSINPQFSDGKEHVTCYTCHRGAKEPPIAPPVNVETPKPPDQPQVRPATPDHP